MQFLNHLNLKSTTVLSILFLYQCLQDSEKC